MADRRLRDVAIKALCLTLFALLYDARLRRGFYKNNCDIDTQVTVMKIYGEIMRKDAGLSGFKRAVMRAVFLVIRVDVLIFLYKQG